MSVQRRRGTKARVWRSELRVDGRGNRVVVADADGPHEVTAAFIPQRSARAEVAGQQVINIVRMIVRHDLPGVDLWSRVEWQGKFWDVVTPPSYHHGTRGTRHLTLDLRERPDTVATSVG